MARKILLILRGGGLTLALLASVCQAQTGSEFTVTYEGGTTVHNGSYSTGYSLNLTTGLYGGGGHSVPGFEDPIPWTVSSSGAVTIKVTYVGTGERPSAAILEIYSRAAFFNASLPGSATNGLGSPIVVANGWGVSEGSKYVAVPIPATGPAEATYTVSPSAWAFTPGFPSCGTSVQLKATPCPVRISLTGVINDPTDKRILIGQKLTSTLNAGGFSAGANPVTYTWCVSGGRPFKNYAASQTLAVYEPLDSTPTKSPVYHSFFANPERIVTVNCTVSIPSLSLLFTASKTLASEAPIITPGTSDIGEFQYLPNATNPDYFKLYGAQIPGVSYIVGMAEVFWVETQPEYWQGDMKGQYGWTQIFDDYSASNSDGGGWLPIGPPTSPGEGTYLDRAHPYPLCGMYTAIGPRVLDDQHTYFFRDSPGFEGISAVPSAPEIQQSFAMRYDTDFRLFVLYDPPGSGTCLVPLRMRSWNATGEFSWTRANGWGPGLDSSSIGTTMDFPYHPVWTQKWP